ncbi:MAG: hypothetical protein M3Q65_02055, partial [Chloroflexota bacterium]|nr:hypothetical protein [Chloroflexota bacterium]
MTRNIAVRVRTTPVDNLADGAPARIGIDAHLLSFAGTYRQAGVSRYIAELLRAFAAEGAIADGPAPARRYIAYTGPARPPAGFAWGGGVRWRHSPLPTGRAPARIA